MPENYSYGLQVDGVELSPVAADGGIGTTFTNPGKVLEDTIELNPADDTETPFKAQGESDPFLIVATKGIDSGTFMLATLDKEVIADLTGGTVDGDGAAAHYAAPIGDPPAIYRSIRFSPKVGDKWTYPRVKLSAKLIGRFRNGELNTLRVNFTVMQPLKAGVAPFYLGTPPAVV